MIDIHALLRNYFRSQPHFLTKHQIDSYNTFITSKIPELFRRTNPVIIPLKDRNKNISTDHLRIECFMGGLQGNEIFYGKPFVPSEVDTEPVLSLLTPMFCRLHNFTYQTNLFVNIVVHIYDGSYQHIQKDTIVLDKILLCQIPIMLRSKMCILHGLSSEKIKELHECPYDQGGYFIIQGKEKVIISQERMINNRILITPHEDGSRLEIRSYPEKENSPPEYTYLYWNSKNHTIQVQLEFIKRKFPLCILFRALGIESDKQILELIVGYPLSTEDNSIVSKILLQYLEPSITDGSCILHQAEAIHYLSTLTETFRTATSTMKKDAKYTVYDILHHKFFCHVSPIPGIYEADEQSRQLLVEKASLLGHLVLKLLLSILKIEEVQTQDSFLFKKVDLPGNLLFYFFRSFYDRYLQRLRVSIQTKQTYNIESYQTIPRLRELIHEFKASIFDSTYITQGLQKGFKGNWGQGQEHYKGIVQDLKRLSFMDTLCHVRRIKLNLPSESKLTVPRKLHTSQWGIVCPVESPDGGDIGLVKHLSILCEVSPKINLDAFWFYLKQEEPMIQWTIRLSFLKDTMIHHKVIVNGRWIGIHSKPNELVYRMRLYRRCGLIPPYLSITWHISNREISFSSDEGRLLRPYFIVQPRDHSILCKSKWKKNIVSSLQHEKEPLRTELSPSYKPPVLYGNSARKIYHFFYDEQDAFQKGYRKKINANTSEYWSLLEKHQCTIEYLDTEELETCLVGMNTSDVRGKTHCEIHPSTIFGCSILHTPFIEHNPSVRNTYSFVQCRQAVSVYVSNLNHRMDQTSNYLHYSQRPFVSTPFYSVMSDYTLNYGINIVVAIASYGGYNQEDSIIMNRQAIDRGLFHSSHHHTEEYIIEKESSKIICHPREESRYSVSNLSSTAIYSFLNHQGVIQEGTFIESDRVILLGCIVPHEKEDGGGYRDKSIYATREMIGGYVSKVLMTRDMKYDTLVKITVTHLRVPIMGDKFASRHGQKGVIGMVYSEEDMPYTREGIRPDIIINPHAIPSRMTLGQLMETLYSFLCCKKGYFLETIPFETNPSLETIGQWLLDHAFHPCGNQILYNGMTGEQMKADVFMGITYYCRLKQMVEDKINSRGEGEKYQLTRQPIRGRKEKGGMRMGEMERDCMLSHGTSKFFRESLMERSDRFDYLISSEHGIIYPPKEQEHEPVRVETPYCFKLLSQECEAMGMCLRLKHG